jgi:hypothetical protein
MGIKPTNAHEDMGIYYIINVVNLNVHVSATVCGHPQVGIIHYKGYISKI